MPANPTRLALLYMFKPLYRNFRRHWKRYVLIEKCQFTDNMYSLLITHKF